MSARSAQTSGTVAVGLRLGAGGRGAVGPQEQSVGEHFAGRFGAAAQLAKMIVPGTA